MSSPDSRVVTEQPAVALEQAILGRARALADEQLNHAAQAAKRIQAECDNRLHLREEREVLTAKAAAERAYHRLVQANEIKLQAELDRLRWDLLQATLAHLGKRFEQFTRDENQYLPYLHRLLQHAVTEIEASDLIVEVNPHDYALLSPRWDAICKLVAPGKHLELHHIGDPHCLGGVLVCSSNRRICIDQTFEGRMRQREAELQQTVLTHLFPGGDSTRLAFS